MPLPIEGLEEKLGYSFTNRELLSRALTHRSCAAEFPTDQCPDNEQLEFLGDSILGFIVSEALVAKHPSMQEGQLSQWKSHLVCAKYLHQCAVTLGLGDFLRLGKGEERNGGRERKTVLANAFEALVAALYLDGGIEAAKALIRQCVLHEINTLETAGIGLLNHKSVLQEKAQALGLPLPRYLTIETTGPEHAKVFTVEVRVGDRLSGRAVGTSKKTASQDAAAIVVAQLTKEGAA